MGDQCGIWVGFPACVLPAGHKGDCVSEADQLRARAEAAERELEQLRSAYNVRGKLLEAVQETRDMFATDCYVAIEARDAARRELDEARWWLREVRKPGVQRDGISTATVFAFIDAYLARIDARAGEGTR